MCTRGPDRGDPGAARFTLLSRDVSRLRAARGRGAGGPCTPAEASLLRVVVRARPGRGRRPQALGTAISPTRTCCWADCKD